MMDKLLDVFPILAGSAPILIATHFVINKKNRNISTVMHLTHDFYQDTAFVRSRMIMRQKIKNMEKEKQEKQEKLFNYAKINESVMDAVISGPTNGSDAKLSIDELVALNRTLSFYNSVRSLASRGDVDIEMLRGFFRYNYNEHWNKLRGNLYDDSDEKDKMLFLDIPELANDWDEPRFSIKRLKRLI